MTGNVVNLNKAKKARAKADKQSKASANSVKFGRTKAQKSLERTEAEKSVAFLDGHNKKT